MDIFHFHAHTQEHRPRSKYQEVSDCQVRASLGSEMGESKKGVSKYKPTSCQSQRSTEPGSALPFSHAAEFVRSRHLASTVFPFFSLETCVFRFKLEDDKPLVELADMPLGVCKDSFCLSTPSP